MYMYLYGMKKECICIYIYISVPKTTKAGQLPKPVQPWRQRARCRAARRQPSGSSQTACKWRTRAATGQGPASRPRMSWKSRTRQRSCSGGPN